MGRSAKIITETSKDSRRGWLRNAQKWEDYCYSLDRAVSERERVLQGSGYRSTPCSPETHDRGSRCKARRTAARTPAGSRARTTTNWPAQNTASSPRCLERENEHGGSRPRPGLLTDLPPGQQAARSRPGRRPGPPPLVPGPFPGDAGDRGVGRLQGAVPTCSALAARSAEIHSPATRLSQPTASSPVGQSAGAARSYRPRPLQRGPVPCAPCGARLPRAPARTRLPQRQNKTLQAELASVSTPLTQETMRIVL